MRIPSHMLFGNFWCSNGRNYRFGIYIHEKNGTWIIHGGSKKMYWNTPYFSSATMNYPSAFFRPVKKKF